MSAPRSLAPKGRKNDGSFVLIRQLVLICILAFAILGVVAAPVPNPKPSNFPSWWFSRGVIVPTTATNTSPAWPTSYPPSDDYAAVNEGQLKNFATQAYNELQANAPAWVWNTTQGQTLTALITGWSTTTGDDYVAINLGQAKTVAQPFYDVLIQIGYSSSYPWTGTGADDYSTLNIGQLKNLFSFDVGLDSDGDNLPDWWELKYFGQLGHVASSSPDGNGISLSADYEQGDDPNNYYSQGGQIITPVFTIVSGNFQTGPAGQLLPAPLKVQVTNSAGGALANAPVTFSVAVGTGMLVANPLAEGGSATLPTTTAADGTAVAYFIQPPGSVFTSALSVQTGTQGLTFTETASSALQPVQDLTSTAGVGDINLTWTIPTNDPVASLQVEQQNSDGTWSTIATLPASSTSFDVTGLDATLSYSFNVSVSDAYGNTASSPSPTSSTPPNPPPRYAVIDLGEYRYPTKIANTGHVFEYLTGSRWDPASSTWNLLTLALTSPDSPPDPEYGQYYVCDMNNSGVVVGYASLNTGYRPDFRLSVRRETDGTVWPPGQNATYTSVESPVQITADDTFEYFEATYNLGPMIPADPTIVMGSMTYRFIDSAGDDYGDEINDYLGYYISPVPIKEFETVTNLQENGIAITDLTLLPESDIPPYPTSGSTGTLFAVSNAGAVISTSEGIRLNGSNLNPQPDGAYANTNNDGISLNDYGALVYSSDYQPILVQNGASHPLPTWGIAINNRQYSSNTGGLVQNWQILSYNGLMESAVDPQTKVPNGNYLTCTPLSTIIPALAQQELNSFSLTSINDYGAIVGTATYSGTNYPTGQHGVMLIPCASKLLNGDQVSSDADGVDFFGNRPSTRDYGYLATDNTSTGAVVTVLDTNNLGVLPLNNGYSSGASVNSILLESQVEPSTANITYSWNRSYRDCAVTIIHSGSQWNVSTVNSASNPTQESNDTGSSRYYTTTVSPKNLLYYADAPGANLPGFFNACQVNDFAYEQTDFTYTLTINIGAATTTAVVHVGQVIIAKRIALTGAVESQWQVQQNTITTTKIPTCQVTSAKVDEIVGGTPTVSIDTAVNENLYQE